MAGEPNPIPAPAEAEDPATRAYACIFCAGPTFFQPIAHAMIRAEVAAGADPDDYRLVCDPCLEVHGDQFVEQGRMS